MSRRREPVVRVKPGCKSGAYSTLYQICLNVGKNHAEAESVHLELITNYESTPKDS